MLPELRRYSYEEFLEITKDKWAEFIDGQIYLWASPSTEHQRVLGKIFAKFLEYFKEKECEPFVAPYDVIFENENSGEKHVVQPDITVICDKSKITEENYKGIPKLIVEVLSPSNASYDYIKKMDLYSRFGVEEYWIASSKGKTIQVFVLKDGVYIEYGTYSKDDFVESAIFSDLKINLTEIFV
ncbi:MAG: Uma2 family endonuclease [Caloramator sp.]|nr:Uma2 family endonuclease [Caloramator sp.]